jgi:hypothetical protein
MRTLSLLALLLAACDGPASDDKPVDTSVAIDDSDGDGFADAASGGDDCNDDIAAINPDALEVCGGVDEDCDGLIDGDDDSLDTTSLPTWYPDQDGDGYGNVDAPSQSCNAPPGAIAGGGDCNDTRADVNPSVAEVCDELATDEDCDGLADDADDSVTGGTPFYADTDGDGFGNPGASVTACAQPADHAVDATDCDDARADISPAGVEVCDDADADEDCDGLADDDDVLDTPVAWYPDADGDGWGGETPAYRCDALPGELADAGDCDDTDPLVNGDDRDGDGTSSCDGDCDDDDAAVLPADCSYTSMAGLMDIPLLPCTFDFVGTATTPVACPDCDFGFDTDATLASGSCLSSFIAEVSYDLDANSLSIWFEDYIELGPFPGTVTAGSGYDVIEWSGTSTFGLTYEGTFNLYR